MVMRGNSCLTLVIRIACSIVSTMFPAAGRRESRPSEHSNKEDPISFIRSMAQRISWYVSPLCISLISERVRNSAFARMAVKGWRRSWETKATILLTTERGSRIGRSHGLLRKDPAGSNRLLDIACFSITTPSPPPCAEFQRGRSPSGFDIDYFVTLDSVKRCPLFELFGQKR